MLYEADLSRDETRVVCNNVYYSLHKKKRWLLSKTIKNKPKVIKLCDEYRNTDFMVSNYL